MSRLEEAQRALFKALDKVLQAKTAKAVYDAVEDGRDELEAIRDNLRRQFDDATF